MNYPKSAEFAYRPKVKAPKNIGTLGEQWQVHGPEFPPTEDGFDPAKPYEQSYRYWVEQYNKFETPGALTLKRSAAGPQGGFALDVRHVHHNSHVTTLSAHIAFQPGVLPRPVSWTRELVYQYADGRRAEVLDSTLSGRLEGQTLVVTRPGGEQRQEVPDTLTNGYGLMHAVQTFPLEPGWELQFALLEDMDVLKPRQTMRCGDPQTFQINGKRHQLYPFSHEGPGTMTHRYWVNGEYRLVAFHLLWNDTFAVFDPNAQAFVSGIPWQTLDKERAEGEYDNATMRRFEKFGLQPEGGE